MCADRHSDHCDRPIELTVSCAAPEMAPRRSCEFTIMPIILQLYCLHASALVLMRTSTALCDGCNIVCIRGISELETLERQFLPIF